SSRRTSSSGGWRLVSTASRGATCDRRPRQRGGDEPPGARRRGPADRRRRVEPRRRSSARACRGGRHPDRRLRGRGLPVPRGARRGDGPLAPRARRRARGARRVHAPAAAPVLRGLRAPGRQHALRAAAGLSGGASDRGRARGGGLADRRHRPLGRRGDRHRPRDPHRAGSRRAGRHARYPPRPRPARRAPHPARGREGADCRMTIRRALFSVYDKTGLAAFARELSGLGVELLASSGSAKLLADERIPVTPLADVTGFGDLLGHRVVTLHPAVHGGILARRDLPEDMAELRAHEIAPIDLVCVNLYPFERTVGRLDVAWEDAIEQIDIGGPALLRAAAKNHAHVVPEFRMRGEITDATRRRLAARAFQRTAALDAAVAGWLGRDDSFPEIFVPVFERYMDLPYGENPHQRGAYYAQKG